LGGATIEQVEVEYNPLFREHGLGAVRAFLEGERLTIQGWAIGHGYQPVEVELTDEGGGRIGRREIGQPRKDIAEAFPAVEGASTSGFRVTVIPAGSGAGPLRVMVDFGAVGLVELATVECELAGEQGGPGQEGETGGWALASIDREVEKVLFGKEGWLYLRRDSNDVIGQQTGKVQLSGEQKSGWRQVLHDRLAASERLGVKWSCLVAPNKEAVYPEFLPDTISSASRRPVHEFLEVAAAVGAPVRYALDPLLKAKAEYELYSRTDTHWNYRGAYFAYRAFCDDLLRAGIDLEPLAEKDLDWVDELIEGDLGSKVRPEPRTGATVTVRVRKPRGRLILDNGVRNHGRVRFFEGAGRGPHCVLFGESFANHLLPFLKETFRRLVFVHTSMFIPEVLEREQAEVALSLPLERFLIRVPDDSNAFAELQETALRKGGELPW
jgi:hypothetical protein